MTQVNLLKGCLSVTGGLSRFLVLLSDVAGFLHLQIIILTNGNKVGGKPMLNASQKKYESPCHQSEVINHPTINWLLSSN